MTRNRPSLQELSDGVYAYIQPDGGWCVNNAGIVSAGGTTILVDTVATEARARLLRDEVRRVAPGGVDVLVNTHHHGDHTFGNAVFAPPATVVAQERMRTEMLEAGTGLRSLWPDVDWGDIPLVPPVLTFRDAVTLHAGELRVELWYVGPAHTTNDVVVWVPERKVLFAGDVVMSGAAPFCLMGSVAGSLQAIQWLRGLGAEVVVAGHGAVTGPQVFDETERYLRWLQGLAEQGAAVGRSPLELAKVTDLGEFAGLRENERLAGNLHRAYAERAGGPLGEPLDIMDAFQDMIAYHGRVPECHA